MFNCKLIMWKIKIISLALLWNTPVKCQSADSLAARQAFYKIISFSQRPNLYYKSFTTLESKPILQPEDTASFNGEFFKGSKGYYVRNGTDEIFQQDGYIVQIKNDKKDILIDKWKTSQNPPGVMPFDDLELNRMILNNYKMSVSKINTKNSLLTMDKTVLQDRAEVQTEVLITFDNVSFLPSEISVHIFMKQKVDGDEIQDLKDKGIQTESLIKTVDSEKYVIHEQTIRTVFTEMSAGEEKVKDMPMWKDKLNKVNNEFITKGGVKGYHVEAN